jgi:hypothetical protein
MSCRMTFFGWVSGKAFSARRMGVSSVEIVDVCSVSVVLRL